MPDQFIQDHFSGHLVHLHGKGIGGCNEHGGFEASFEQAVSGFESHKTAAQNQGVSYCGERMDDVTHMGLGSQAMDIFKIRTPGFDGSCIGACSNEKPVKRERFSAFNDDLTPSHVNF